MIGSILMSPMTGLTFVLRKVAEAVDDAREADRRAIMAALQDLHRLIERGAITDDEFDSREKVLLDRLEAMSGSGAKAGDTP